MNSIKEKTENDISATLKIPYYSGCTLKTTAKNFEDSAIASAKVLGIELIELPRWNCCGTVFSLAADDLIHHVAPIRNLIRVQEMYENGIVTGEHRLVTVCSMCFNTLKSANMHVTENSENLTTINEFMDREENYKGEVEVLHFLELLREMELEGIEKKRQNSEDIPFAFNKIKKKVQHPLEDLKIAPYYGCMLLKPKEIGIDDPEDPSIQGKLLEALGADVIDNPYKKLCCGSYQTIRDRYAVAELAYDILTHAKMAGADAITTSCPLCAFNLDNRQKEVKEKYPDFEQIPVFYMTQLMALAFGVDKKYFGFDLHYIDPVPLLKNKNHYEEG